MSTQEINTRVPRQRLTLSRAADSANRILVRDKDGHRCWRRMTELEIGDRVVEISNGCGLLGNGDKFPLWVFRRGA